MYEDHSSTNFNYTINDKLTTRCLTSIWGNTNANLFAFSTDSLTKKNQIHVVEFLEDDGKILPRQLFQYPGSINKIFSHPTDEQIFAASTTENLRPDNIKQNLLLFKAKTNDEAKEVGKVDPAELDIQFQIERERLVQSVNFCNEDKMLITDSKMISLFDINSQKFEETIAAKEKEEFLKSEQDPHNPNLIATISSNSVYIFDIRDKSAKYVIKDAHKLDILDVDFNPNKQYCLVTGSEDCLIKFWDFRKPTLALKVIDDVYNCVESVKYNRSHDLLLISSTNDGRINLHRASSVSSFPIGVTNSKEEDCLVKSYDEHEDGVYSIAWSAASSWIFASISYNSSLVVNIVPQSEKIRILY